MKCNVLWSPSTSECRTKFSYCKTSCTSFKQSSEGAISRQVSENRIASLRSARRSCSELYKPLIWVMSMVARDTAVKNTPRVSQRAVRPQKSSQKVSIVSPAPVVRGVHDCEKSVLDVAVAIWRLSGSCSASPLPRPTATQATSAHANVKGSATGRLIPLSTHA